VREREEGRKGRVEFLAQKKEGESEKGGLFTKLSFFSFAGLLFRSQQGTPVSTLASTFWLRT